MGNIARIAKAVHVTLDCQVTKIEIHLFSLGKSTFLEKSIFSREVNFFSLGKSKRFFPEIHFFLGKIIFSLSKKSFFLSLRKLILSGEILFCSGN